MWFYNRIVKNASRNIPATTIGLSRLQTQSNKSFSACLKCNRAELKKDHSSSARFGSEKELTVRYGWSPTTRRGLSSGAGAFLDPFEPEAGFEVSSVRLGTGMITGLTFDGAAPVFVALTEAFV